MPAPTVRIYSEGEPPKPVSIEDVQEEFEALLYQDNDDEIVAQIAVQLRRRGWDDEE